jgi:hypothetical protein
MADVVLYKGNSSPTVSDTIKVGGVPQDLTGSTISFQARDPRTNTLVLDVSGAQITMLNQTTNKGGVTYAPNATDTAVAYQVPPLVGWWHVVLPGGAVQDTPETFNVYIRDHSAPRSTDLCTVTDVRQALRISADQTRNDQIQSFISRGSPMIMRWLDMQIAPASTAVTYTFLVDITGGGLVVELNPYVLRAATTVTLSPEGAATVLATSQYSLLPQPNPDGIYKRIQLSPFLGGIISPTALIFGYSKLAITGNWGMATVPDDIVQAATVIIASWIDVAQGQYQGTEVFTDLPRLTLPNADARSAWATLGAYKRMTV